MTSHTPPRRILVIDDNPAIHDDFRKVLCPPAPPAPALREAAAALFGKAPAPVASPRPAYAIDVASRGQDGVALVRSAQDQGQPYALAFVDMRMPNGWTGLETTREIWRVAPQLQVVLCTAFSDYSWDQIRDELPRSDRFLILKKPFDNIEVQQLAAALTERHATEQALAEKERLLCEAQQAARIGHVITDLRSGERSHSTSLVDLFGVDAAAAADARADTGLEPWLRVIDPDWLAPLRARMDTARATGGHFEAICRMTHPREGRPVWLAARGHWEYDAQGRPLRQIGSFQDVSASHASLEQQRLLEACVAHINDMVIIAEQPDPGAPHRIVYVNESFCRVTGHPRDRVTGQSIRLLRGPHTDGAELDRIEAAVEQGQPIRTELQIQVGSGGARWVDLDIVPVRLSDRRCGHWVGILRDISAHKQAQERIEHLAFYDALTDLPNRRLLLDRLQRQLSACARQPVQCALMFIDLDNFKHVNDTQGHDAGDLLLQEVAQRLSHCVRDDDTIARFGGDEFVVLLRNLGEDTAAAGHHADLVARKILDRLAAPYDRICPDGLVSGSVGSVLFGDAPVSADDLLRRADIAMYQAKVSGKNTHAVYDAASHLSAQERAYLIDELGKAVVQGRLELKYHPQFDAHSRLVGAEALLRWHCAGRGQVPPAVFLPLAEQCGLILPIGAWVLDAACGELARWAQQPELHELKLAINLSVRQLVDPGLPDLVAAALRRHAAPAHRLEIELPHDGLVDVIDTAAVQTGRLSALGVGVALDKFGCGELSRPVLERLAVDRLKIDRSLVRDVVIGGTDPCRTREIIGLGHALGLQVVAEGVETTEQQQQLLDLGCDGFQGYVFSRPLPRAQFLAYVHAMRASHAEIV
ncbi:MAG: regulator, domain-like protein [Pseudomonadota bacterium]|jgi:diguanylate cyclase (GGDEF)-like protein/PAS domain S-box-containing protein